MMTSGGPNGTAVAQKLMGKTKEAEDKVKYDETRKSVWKTISNTANKLAEATGWSDLKSKTFAKSFYELFKIYDQNGTFVADNDNSLIESYDAVMDQHLIDTFISTHDTNKNYNVDVAKALAGDAGRLLAFAVVYICSMRKCIDGTATIPPSPCTSIENVEFVFKSVYSNVGGKGKDQNEWLKNAKIYAKHAWREIATRRIADGTWGTMFEYMIDDSFYCGFVLFQRFLQKMITLGEIDSKKPGMVQFLAKITNIKENVQRRSTEQGGREAQKYGGKSKAKSTKVWDQNEKKLNGTIDRIYETARKDSKTPMEIYSSLPKKLTLDEGNAFRVLLYKNYEIIASNTISSRVLRYFSSPQWAMYMVYNLCHTFKFAPDVLNDVLKDTLVLFDILMENNFFVTFKKMDTSFLLGKSTSKRKRSLDDSDVYNDILTKCKEIDRVIIQYWREQEDYWRSLLEEEDPVPMLEE